MPLADGVSDTYLKHSVAAHQQANQYRGNLLTHLANAVAEI